MSEERGGPLSGTRVVEMASIGPVPFCGMLLADLGADVIRIDRVSGGPGTLPDPMLGIPARGRRSIAIDIKTMGGHTVVERIIAGADILIEGYRPGKMEALGLGPDEWREINPGLIFGRMTGWGQTGPLADAAGHDINYLGLVGALDAIGPRGSRPIPPLNLVADYGGGGLYLAVGVLAALAERQRSGLGQVVDAAMIDGAASLMTVFYQLTSVGFWREERGTNLLDGGAPFYRTYQTADGGYVAVGAIEPQFYRALLRGLGIDPNGLPDQHDTDAWDVIANQFAARFETKTRAEWVEVFAGTDACVTPVLSISEAPSHPHHVAHRTFVTVNGNSVPGPAPRFDRSRVVPGRAGQTAGSHSDEILLELGFTESEVADLRFNKGIG